MFFLYKSLTACTLINTSPLPFGLSPIAQTCANSLKDCISFARGEVGTHIDRDISLLMPLRFVRQAVANRRRSRLYYTHKGSRTSKTSDLRLSYTMKAQFLACGTRNAKHKGEQLQLVAVEANGLVRDESSALIGSPPCGSCFVFE